ncbi:NAD-dependent epimerase/dehydratase family protein [Phosphitispora fastidiosa]|uniref:NAD-dependent epimerase/dehydratase family protein n=1 Tax=Phosphitispora fastidiosa TaxID=2837202 RepID=UPI001E6348F5|nr:nucleoside-diphosphate-sugar epimerase [Phosphitispora fastidiosa]
MNVLVSGAAGLYGIHTVEELLSRQDITKIYGLDDLSRGYLDGDSLPTNWLDGKVQNLKQRYQDISVKEMNSLNIDVVIHLAGYNSGKESMNTPEEYFLNNEYGTFQLMQTLLRTKNRPFFVYASTVEVYGAGESPVVDEKSSVIPQSTYAVTKLAAEQHIMAVGRWYNYPVTSIRFSNTFGENHSIYGYNSVVASFIDRALRNEPLIVYGTGEQTRDFIYVKDAVRALSLAVSYRSKVEGLIINIGSGTQLSINELANSIIRLTSSTSEIINLPCEKGKHLGFKIDIGLAGRSIKWFPTFTLEEGLLRTINWHKGLYSI